MPYEAVRRLSDGVNVDGLAIRRLRRLPLPELATNDLPDYRIKKAVENLPPLRDKLATIPICKDEAHDPRIGSKLCRTAGCKVGSKKLRGN